jgi:glycosyltransferase involved in cell wall biosynthesis
MRSFKINLFTYGDSRDINTWSNLPYYFQKALIAHDVRVQPTNLSPSDSRGFYLFSHLWNLRARLAARAGLNVPSDVFRTKINYVLANNRVKAASRRYVDADLNVFMTFSFSSYRYAAVPVVHYCDRTYEHYLEDGGQIPTRRDRAFIQIDRENIENADLVLTTSEDCRQFITSRYQATRVIHLKAGLNRESADIDPHALIAQKERSKDILFIGRGVYKRGVDILIKAFTIFNQQHGGQFALRLVGIRPHELPRELQTGDKNIHCYGYLDRSVAGQLALYNQLLQSARLFVFPTRPGPVAGVLREAQLNCTPVIISNVPGTSERVMHDGTGILVDSLEPEEFARHMSALVMDESRWRRLAYNAHVSIKDRTWSKTVDTFLEIVRTSGLLRDP